MEQIVTERLVLRGFQESDYGDLFEFLSQLRGMNLRDIRASHTKTAENTWPIASDQKNSMRSY